MIFSKGNFEIGNISKTGSGILSLNEDGSTSTVLKTGTIAVGPVPDEVKSETVLEDTGPISCTISSASAKGIAKHIPVDKKYGGRLEFVDVRENGRYIESVTRDELRREDKTTIVKESEASTDSHTVLSQGARIRNSPNAVRVILNRKALIEVLSAIDKACPSDSAGETPIWMTVDKELGILLQSVNVKTDQRACGCLGVYDYVEKDWLLSSKWEDEVLSHKTLRGCARKADYGQ